ncbi:MAG: SIS domain-containing protein [Clostridia bacterium]|nr:SIS domain-containing protein [Clostridia bacterium]
MSELYDRYPSLGECRKEIAQATEMLIDCYKNGGKLLLCGNGGSSADCEHISGELMKGFLSERKLRKEKKDEMRSRCSSLGDDTLDSLQGALPAIPLSSLSALGTAFCNDAEPKLVFAQGVFGLGKEGDVLICISTSGNSANVVEAAKVAKALCLKVISLTGRSGGKLKELSDVCICVPETETYKVQELHLPVYHKICADVEKAFFE